MAGKGRERNGQGSQLRLLVAEHVPLALPTYGSSRPFPSIMAGAAWPLELAVLMAVLPSVVRVPSDVNAAELAADCV